ncbi:uncharacterized protein LOC110191821 [Drosophila serrata]|uniref:uncharacterized protein LOC110191821 n=1 Tax=Drosophila serrata TaxID=7274 RepID=UPI000A1D12B2|nr:uncharacterized protein LOC110191821 [Drosophila serrata]
MNRTNKAADEVENLIPKNPILPIPLIRHDFIYTLKCSRSLEVSQPLVVQTVSGGKSTKSVDEPQKKPPRLTVVSELSSMSEEESEPEVEIQYRWNSPRLMILCEDGDINCAIHYLVESLQDPFASNSVATLLLQESILEEFIDRMKDRLEPLSPEISAHPVFVQTLKRLKHLQARTTRGNPKTVPLNASPVLVYDLCHRHLGKGPTGVITVHTFRTMKEAIELQSKEPLPFTSATIWNEKLAAAYELVARSNILIFLLNCFYVDLDPISLAFTMNQNSVKIADGYHYETLTFRSNRKVIVHPVGTIWGKLVRDRALG